MVFTTTKNSPWEYVEFMYSRHCPKILYNNITEKIYKVDRNVPFSHAKILSQTEVLNMVLFPLLLRYILYDKEESWTTHSYIEPGFVYIKINHPIFSNFTFRYYIEAPTEYRLLSIYYCAPNNVNLANSGKNPMMRFNKHYGKIFGLQQDNNKWIPTLDYLNYKICDIGYTITVYVNYGNGYKNIGQIQDFRIANNLVISKVNNQPWRLNDFVDKFIITPKMNHSYETKIKIGNCVYEQFNHYVICHYANKPAVVKKDLAIINGKLHHLQEYNIID